MERMQIDLGHKPPVDRDEPLAFELTPEERDRAQFWQGLLELQRMERNVRDHLAELAKP